MPAKKPRIMIDGVAHVKCCVPECKELLVDGNTTRNRSGRCKNHFNEYRKNWEKRNWEKNGARENKKRKKTSQSNIEKQLSSNVITQSTFKGCTKEQEYILKFGTVEDLLKLG